MKNATTVTATARILKNYILVEAGKERWIARPLASGQSQITRAISALFSTHYQLTSENEPAKVLANVHYDPKRDEILVQVEEEKWHTKSSLFGPSTFVFNGVKYVIQEKITGRFAILAEDQVVIQGVCRFRSVMMPEYPPEMERFLGNLAVGLLVRLLFWELGF